MTSTTTGNGTTSAPGAQLPSSGPVNGHNKNGTTVDEQPDVVMMTPIKKEIDHTILRVERLESDPASCTDTDKQRHVAGGQHQGIIINKQISNIGNGTSPTAGGSQSGPKYDLRLSFKVFLVNSITQIQQLESRELRFWFQLRSRSNEDNNNNNHNGDSDSDDDSKYYNAQSAHSFFRELVNPSDFPKNYVSFIMKLMKTMQKPVYRPLKQIELEVRTVDEPNERPPSSASRPCSVDENSLAAQIPLTESSVLEMIEAAYPNTMPMLEIAQATRAPIESVYHLVVELQAKGVVRLNETAEHVVRVTSDETTVKRVRQMPDVVRSQQPTVAIITAQFCEKLAVDAMIEDKDTYVRFKSEGDSNVYTLGNIGRHRVVATKLPAVGNTRSAMIAAGNTTTRLLGTFQHVEYVFLVGIGGGVPHYTDYQQHVRLGDVVVSSAPARKSNITANGSPGFMGTKKSEYVYVHCEKLHSSPDEPLNASNSSYSQLQTVDSFNYRFWCPYSMELQDIAKNICTEAERTGERPWERYLIDAKQKLSATDDLDVSRPDPSTDKLYMSIGTNDIIEMTHPEPARDRPELEYDPRSVGMPKIHFGAIGSGRKAIGNEQLRQDIANKYGIKAFDIEYDTVIESIFGNRKDRYIIIRGIADYKDGSRKKEWQTYSALAASAFMKAILDRLEPIRVEK